MVFESAVSQILNSVLGNFVENLDSTQLNLGIWGGDIELKNLVLKPTALDDLDLPIQTVYGRIGKLVLKIPWKSLYTSPTIASLEDVYLLAAPNKQVKYDEEKERRCILEAKRKAIQQVHAARKAEEEKNKPKADATFVQKLTQQVIKNIQLHIVNIHIRYEDKVTNPRAPFALGITLGNLAVESTDAQWNKAITDDISKIYKVVALEGLAVYWNCNTTLYGTLKREKLIISMQKEIATKKNFVKHYNYILGPINASARLCMNPKPELDEHPYTLPVNHLNLDMGTLFIGVSKKQYRDIIALADQMEKMSRGLPYRKFRPNVSSYKGHYKEWWHFAYNCVLEDIRRRKQDWQWKHMLAHRKMGREYGKLYKKQLYKTATAADLNRIEQCEEKLDLTSIIIIRHRVEIEYEKSEKVKTDGKKGWLGGWFGGSKQGLETVKGKNDMLLQFEKEMTPEEKAKLYKAIDYHENATPTVYPEKYIDNSFTFLLRKLHIVLTDDDIAVKHVMKTKLTDVKLKIETRAAASALKVQVNIENLKTTGLKQPDDDFVPMLIQPEANKTKSILDVMFETNPIDKKCDQRIRVTVRPVCVTYDAMTINKMVEIMTLPPDTNLEQISAAAGNKLTDVKQMTATGLQYTIEKHVRIDLDIDVHAPYIVIPYGGRHREMENVLVVNLGRFKIYSLANQMGNMDVKKLFAEGKTQEQIFEKILTHCYDRFILELTRLQVVVAQSEENWRKALVSDTPSPIHILNPLTLKLTYAKCLITDDPNIPWHKVNAELPNIHLAISDARLMLLIALLTSIPYPTGAEPQPLVKNKFGGSASSIALKSLLQDTKSATQIIAAKPLPKDTTRSEYTQFKILEANFVMSELCVTITQQDTLDSPKKEFATFAVHLLEGDLCQRTSDMNVKLHLGSVTLMHTRDSNVIKIISTPTASKSKKKVFLFKVDYTQVNPESPDLHLLHKSCETSLTLTFTKLALILHQEGLLSLMAFANSVQENLTDLLTIATPTAPSGRTLKRTISNISDSMKFENKPGKAANKNISVEVASIKFKIVADLGEVSVLFCTDKSEIASVAVRGATTEVVVKKNCTQVIANLKEFTVIDMNPETRHNLIVTCMEENAFSAQVLLNNLGPEDTERSDMIVTVRIGGARIVFLNWFVCNMLAFLNQFQAAQQAIIDASGAAAQKAKENVVDAYQKATKMSLNIHLRAPDIIVPVDSKSFDTLYLSLGVISISNKFLTLDVKNQDDHAAVVDQMVITLTDLELTRALLDSKYEIIEEIDILQPLTVNINLKRNLSVSWYTAVPDLDVSFKIDSINVRLSEDDYKMVMSILSGNLTEGKETTPPPKVTNRPSIQSGISTKTQVTMATVDKMPSTLQSTTSTETNKVHIFLKFTLILENLVIDLFMGSGKVNLGSSLGLDTSDPVSKSEAPATTYRPSLSRTANSHLAKFCLENLTVTGRILSDDKIVMNILLVNCTLDDMRKGKEDKLNRLFERSAVTSVGTSNAPDSALPLHMIDVMYQQSAQDRFIDVRVYSFTLILSVEYLVKISEFFATTEQGSESGAVINGEPSTTGITMTSIQSQTSHMSTVKRVSAKSSRSTRSVHEEPVQSKPEVHLTVNLKIEQPDIVLVDHMENIDTDAMILQSEVVLKYRVLGERQVVNGIIRDLQLYTCNFNPAKRSETRYNVLHPVTISLAGSSPEGKGLHLELIVGNVLISVSPDTIELLARVSSSLSPTTVTEDEATEEAFSFQHIWEPKVFNDNDYWFLKSDKATEATEEFMDKLGEKPPLQELCIVSMRSIIITVEAGVGNKTLPMIMFETTLIGNVRNWTSQLTVDAVLTIQMAYYNSSLALWEPLIEPIEEVHENRIVTKPWGLKVDVSTCDLDDASSLTSPTLDSDQDTSQPVMSIDLTSDATLELTVTKTCLEVLSILSNAFASAMDLKQAQVKSTTHVRASFKVLNDIGEDVTILFDKSSFKIGLGGDAQDINKSAAVPLQLKPELMETKTVRLRKALNSRSLSSTLFLHVVINSKNCELALPLVKADKRFFMIDYRGDGNNNNWGVISDVRVDDGVMVLTLRSIVQVHNHFSVPIEVYYMTAKGDELELVGTVEPNGTLNLPLKAVYTATNELFFSVEGYVISRSPYVWKDLQKSLTAIKILHCPARGGDVGKKSFYITAIGEMEQVYYENTNRHTMASTCFNIHLRPSAILKNFLPLTIVTCVDEMDSEDYVKAGDTLRLPNVYPGRSVLVIRIPDYLEKEWTCRQTIYPNADEFSVWTFDSRDSPTKMSLDLGVHTVEKNGSLVLSLYCPFWMLNKTGLMLGYRSSDENLNILHHPANFKGPILFSFNPRNFFGKKKASIRVGTGDWSDKFSLDVAGSSGVVYCKADDHTYQIGVHNQLTYNTLTKQVTFTPYYVIINEAPFVIECQESDRPGDPWIKVEPKSCSALWPKSELEDKLLKVRVAGTEEISAPFLYTESHTTLLRLNNKYGGMSVDIQLTEGAAYINIAPYAPGSAPALIINYTGVKLDFWEKYSVQIRSLQPKHCMLYTWENPAGPRMLVWENARKVEIENDLRKDACGTFTVHNEKKISWCSFLDGMQRILLFSEDPCLAEMAVNIFEVIQKEITLSLHGLGLSLVNNMYRQEIMYMGIASSGIIWEARKINKRRFKPLSLKDSTHIEAAYQDWTQKKQTSTEDLLSCPSRTVIDGKIELDFGIMQMFKPNKRILRRTFQTGAWLQLKTSPNQTQLHVKLNRLQIDNQMYDCIFPVVLAPVPPPKSVAVDSGIKPFVEISIVQLLMKNSQIIQYKYYKVLVQEFHIKVDLGFINALFDLMEQAENSDEDDRKLFLTDMTLVEEALYSHASGKSAQEQKSFYDLLHFSPLKIHVSFSMASGTSAGQSASTPNFINVILQGVGVTLTDLQDVIFKLAFFERTYTFLTQRQLISEVTSHYVGQSIKQLYVLVLGLDVIGNPYGLVVGITKGVEDLFYEPFQGAIQGPSEFAEGLALGVRSLFGHTVGGALGAATRITGVMGKGIAALTFDDDFQRKRRDQINKKPATMQEGLARSGKGLVMGVVDGVTGVFTKPVTGAQEEGVGGFFKGLGKGAMGLVARPAAGLVDFASGSLDAVKRVTEVGEDTLRLRPPRFLQADGLVRPYNRVEAEGHKILTDLSKGKYAKTDVYVYHYEIIPKKEMLLLTDKRIAYVTHNELFGGWQIDWSYTWQELKHPVSVVPKGVAISLTDVKKKRFYSSSEATKVILITDPVLKEEICSKIESLRST